MGTICRKTESGKNNMGQTASETHQAILIRTGKAHSIKNKNGYAVEKITQFHIIFIILIKW